MKNAVEYLEPNMFHTPSPLLYTKMPKTKPHSPTFEIRVHQQPLRNTTNTEWPDIEHHPLPMMWHSYIHSTMFDVILSTLP
jgi:hypothetical protein